MKTHKAIYTGFRLNDKKLCSSYFFNEKEHFFKKDITKTIGSVYEIEEKDNGFFKISELPDFEHKLKISGSDVEKWEIADCNARENFFKRRESIKPNKILGEIEERLENMLRFTISSELNLEEAVILSECIRRVSFRILVNLKNKKIIKNRQKLR